ncbi:DUF2065 family protein [Neoroseomonas oryzicola]|uniref:DUF2065 family protein n=1 Tax=Neoroseomonas oryzicola TaxID=535904 RepID=A0A9X9WLX5_9PROT|nr:DUF2065 family protein [Neoroseomonas oryzicola]MBR0661335.1 DUF2065 family protein [Neoroseomonas oryzicola]NKE18825.1 DUF2065 family protein [Neoroseomonas oryzicola]
MTPLAGFLLGVSGMLILDGAACWLLPKLLRDAYRARAEQGDAQMRARGAWLIAGGALGMIVAVVQL